MLLVGQQERHLACNKLRGGHWHGYLSRHGTDLHMTKLMPQPLTVSYSSKMQIGFIFLVLAHSGSPGLRAVKRVLLLLLLRRSLSV